ncbi:hypothetical protein L596_023002 [Steinernema carpocapsae]|uniref:G-protein coupled receptors family 1 profile domain-containing protein n=1 Tax=Steinernema carpocapsae TaxID=34508 RepID=A0A4U5MCA0_STECR|nr:hypothetical protein L596_023002 [Steinernema carpocapsae]
MCSSCSLVTAGLADFFLALDRYLAITYHVKYLIDIKNKFTCYSILTSFLVTLTVAFVSWTQRVNTESNVFTFVDQETRIMYHIFNYVSFGFVLLDIVITIIFIFKLKRVKRTVRTNLSINARKANVIVRYQMVLASLFWVTPTVINFVVFYGFGVNIKEYLGPWTFTSLTFYIFSCGMLYRYKLKSKIVITPTSA